MPRLLGVDIPNDKQIVISLRYLYGVGDYVARELCHKAGIDPTKQARDLQEEEVARLTTLLEIRALLTPTQRRELVRIFDERRRERRAAMEGAETPAPP